MFSFEIVGTVVNTSFLSVLFQDNSATTTYTHELNVFALESSIICEYTFDYLESVQLKITMINNSQSSLVFKNISLTKFADGRSDMDFAMIGSNSVKRIRHQKNGVNKDVFLPNVVRSNPIFGHGFGLYTNRYIVEDGVLEENVKVVKGSELTWTLTLAGSPKSYYAYAGLPSPCIDHVVECSPLAPRVFTGASEDIGIDVVTQNGRSFVVISLGASYTSVEDLAQNSTFIYALKEPNKIQIADGIDGLIDVEPNGVIQTLNENGEQVKSNFAVRYVLQE